MTEEEKKRKRYRVSNGTKPSKRSGVHLFQPGKSGNPGGRPAGETFSNMLKRILNTKKRFKTTSGKLIEATELELIASRAIKELRTGTRFDVKLFEAILNRVDGKVVEPIDTEGIKEIADDLNARDIIMRRFGGLVLARRASTDGGEDDPTRTVEVPVQLEPMAKN